jgi:hypothetical protein
MSIPIANAVSITNSIKINNKLLVLSYNESEQDFYDSDVSSLLDNVISINPNIICICTQKSKSQVALAIPGKKIVQKTIGFEGSNSTKHFPHVFGNLLLKKNYELVYKKDASFMIRGVTENNNVRTRIYQLKNDKSLQNQKKESTTIIPNFKKYKVINKLSSTIGSVQTMSLNRQAIYIELDIMGKKTVIVNTELAPDFNQKQQREKEFLDIIQEFGLSEKYFNGYNIILCGSLNFRLKFLSVVNEKAKQNLFNYLSKISSSVRSNGNNSLLNKNELRIYIANLIIDINNNKNQKINKIPENNGNTKFTEALERNNKLKILLEQFFNNIKKTGYTMNCNYNSNKDYRVYNPLKLGSVIKNSVDIFNQSHAQYKKNNSSTTGVANGLVKGVGTGIYKTVSKGSKQLVNISPLKKKNNFKLPAMCDKILFALSKNNNSALEYNNFQVFQQLQKSRNLPIYATFSF